MKIKKINLKYIKTALIISIIIIPGIIIQFYIIKTGFKVFMDVLREIPEDTSKASYNAFLAFKYTPAWDLAKAVEDQDVDEIRRQVIEQKIPVDIRDKRFGATLLIKAADQRKFKSLKCLLELGADPNLPDTCFGYTPLIIAVRGDTSGVSVQTLLKYGADPNLLQVHKSKRAESEFNEINYSFPLYFAARKNNAKVAKILVDTGADIHMNTEACSFGNLVNTSLVYQNYDVTLYLLNLGADYKTIFINLAGEKITPVDFLRSDVYPLGSKRYKEKMQLVAWFKAHGMDYYAVPISERTKRDIKRLHPDSVDIYLKLY